MDVIDAAINAVQTSDNDSRDRTNKQIFTQFNKELFALSQSQEFKELVELATNTANNSQVINQSKRVICSYFQKITETKVEELKLVQKLLINQQVLPSFPSPHNQNSDKKNKDGSNQTFENEVYRLSSTLNKQR